MYHYIIPLVHFISSRVALIRTGNTWLPISSTHPITIVMKTRHRQQWRCRVDNQRSCWRPYRFLDCIPTCTYSLILSELWCKFGHFPITDIMFLTIFLICINEKSFLLNFLLSFSQCWNIQWAWIQQWILYISVCNADYSVSHNVNIVNNFLFFCIQTLWFWIIEFVCKKIQCCECFFCI